MRLISDRNILDEVCLKFCNILEKHCKYIVVSGFVAISAGRSRGTEDIDVIIERISSETFTKMHRDLEKAGFECIQGADPLELYNLYLRDNLPIRYTLAGYPLPEMEVKPAKDFLDEIQIQNRIKIPLTGLDVWFSSIETNIAFKEELLKSDKDLEDSRHLRKVFKDEINETNIVKLKELIKKYRLKAK